MAVFEAPVVVPSTGFANGVPTFSALSMGRTVHTVSQILTPLNMAAN
jgi:hypothetical protein